MNNVIYNITPNKKLGEQLSILVERKDQSRIRKFFKRHKKEMSAYNGKSITEIKDEILEYIKLP